MVQSACNSIPQHFRVTSHALAASDRTSCVRLERRRNSLAVPPVAVWGWSRFADCTAQLRSCTVSTLFDVRRGTNRLAAYSMAGKLILDDDAETIPPAQRLWLYI